MYVLLKLAKDFPDEIFVLCAQAAIGEHRIQLIEFLRTVSKMNLDNVEYVPMPINTKHHYYKRELIRNAKGTLSPFRAQQYQEGFGLTNAESVACGTPLLITDSDSTQELWKNEVDGLFADGDYHSYRLAVKHWNSYDFKPVNKFSLENYARGYEELLKKYE
jgi:glycosyltransferase involved in cell wall biosynthesis